MKIMTVALAAATIAVFATTTFTAATAAPRGERAVSAGLKSLFAGARVNMSRFVNVGMIDILADFNANGSITGSVTHDAGSDAGTGVGIRGTWWVKGGKLCTKFAAMGYVKGDPPAGACYTISGSGKQYTASGPDGLLVGRFRLDK